MHDAGNDGPIPYIVCEYVERQSLAERLRKSPPLSLRQGLGLIVHILEALRVAHEKGIVHRDLKPANIFLTRDGKPKIGDFGLAKAQSLPSGTIVGKLMGTPAYMSPEQCRGKGTTAASDLYAVGVMLFEMAVGRRPFPGPSIPDFLVQHTSTLPPSARETSAELPLALDVIVHRAMEKDPGARFKNAAEFLKAVLELHRGLTPALDVTPGPQGSPTAERVALIPGVVLGGRYELVRILGQGGMGQVWLAKDQSMDLTEVAVKVLPPELWRDADSRVSLVKEAKLSLRLAHPCIVRLINLESGVSPFPVMEYVAGLSLGDELAGRRELDAGPMTPAEALPIVEDLAAALDHAHEQKVIHRDIKPSNVMLQCRPGGGFRAKLADFGIAAELISFKSRQTGVVPAGTLAYMSPEQVACQKLDARSDVYALGANLYQMLTIAPTFAGGDLAWAIQNAPVPEPEGVPQTIARVVLRALARKPDDRPATAGALAEELCRAVKGGSVRAESCESSADDGGGRIAKQFGSDGQGESCGLSATPGG